MLINAVNSIYNKNYNKEELTQLYLYKDCADLYFNKECLTIYYELRY